MTDLIYRGVKYRKDDLAAAHAEAAQEALMYRGTAYQAADARKAAKPVLARLAGLKRMYRGAQVATAGMTPAAA